MLNQSEMDKVVLEAKKSITVEQMKDAIRRCSCGGYPVDMSLKGGDITNGKTNT